MCVREVVTCQLCSLYSSTTANTSNHQNSTSGILYTHTPVHTHAWWCAHTNAHTCMCAHAHARAHIHSHSWSHTQCACTHTHTLYLWHTHTQSECIADTVCRVSRRKFHSEDPNAVHPVFITWQKRYVLKQTVDPLGVHQSHSSEDVNSSSSCLRVGWGVLLSGLCAELLMV